VRWFDDGITTAYCAAVGELARSNKVGTGECRFGSRLSFALTAYFRPVDVDGRDLNIDAVVVALLV
jgi:hypothetical protein